MKIPDPVHVHSHHHDHFPGKVIFLTPILTFQAILMLTLEVKEFAGPNCRLIGPADEASLIPGLDIAVADGDAVEICETDMTVLATPGHTRGHVSFYAKEW